MGLVDASGNLQARYGYDPYGQTITKTGAAADGNPFRYTGAYLDSTGLYKMGARYYDPARGRFTQLDPLGNGYGYASDNPVNLTDASGLCDPDECNGPRPGADPNEPFDPFAEPLDPSKIDYTNPPEGYPEITFKDSHIFGQSKHGFDGLDSESIQRGIADDAYRRWQIGEFNQNTGKIDPPVETHFYVGSESITVDYEGYIFPDGSGINISSSWRPGFNK